MSTKPTYLILAANAPLSHPQFVYEMNLVPMGTPFEWCSIDQAETILKDRSAEKSNFNCQVQYVN